MRAVFPHLRDQWPALVATFLLATVARLLMLADPQILRLIVDGYVLKLNQLPADTFYRGVLLLIGASVVVGLLARTFRTLQEYWIAVVARRVGSKLYAKSIAHSLLLPYREFETKRSGELLHTIQRARLDAEEGISGAVRLYLGIVAVVAVTIYAFTLHPLLGLVHLIAVPLVGVAMIVISTPIRKEQRRIMREASALTGSSTEAIRNVETLKGLGVEGQQIDRIHDENRRVLGLEESKLRLIRRFTFIEGIFFHTMRAGLLCVMLWLVFHRSITTGEFLSLFLYTSAIFTPITEAGAAVARFHEARATFDTLDEVLLLPTEERAKGAVDPGTIRSVTFDNVSLRYGEATEPALRNVDVDLRAGQTIAFTGTSGAGKSSLVKLLVGLYQPTEGTLVVNGTDLRRLDLDAFRVRIGLVTQETQLFSGNIRENLQIVRPDATDDECLAALTQAAAQSLLARAGQGLDTHIGEGALNLSGGERQRLAIARALLRHPDVLVFDEATSSLDALTERAISNTIRSLGDGRRLTVIVSHSLTTIAHADRIYVLSHGAIIESGTHDELVGRGGVYTSLWREQQGVFA